MPPPNLDGRIAPLLRGLGALTALAALNAGGGLFFFPNDMQGLWPWNAGPFDARFLGAIYLSGLMGLGLLAWYGRWAPARLVLPMMFVSTALGLLVSIVYLRHFDFSRLGAWLWFGAHLALLLVSLRFLWRYSQVTPPLGFPTPPGWRAVLLTQALVLGLYGFALFAAPVALTRFWPWAVDAFHGRLYSTMFTTMAVGALGLAQFAAPVERLTLGLTYSALGLLALFGAAIADASQHVVRWNAPGTWIWLTLFALEFLLGLALIWWSSYAREAAR